MLDIQKLVKELTLEEKAKLCSGADNWHTFAVERLDLPSVMVSDGPHGLRKESADQTAVGADKNIKAVCLPSGAALASSFDRSLLKEVGDTLGLEAQSENVHTLLGPAVNMKRSPLCGRNFEYFSEDPYLTGELAVQYVNGVQEQGVGVSVKHFAANNQEFRRMSISVQIEERTLREIYLTAFETIVKKAKPWTIMCSYNRINHVYSCENDWLLNQVLRHEWGFESIVMTDWGAMNNRPKALQAGLNLEMPSSREENTKVILRAIQDGSLSIDTLDHSTTEMLTWIDRCLSNSRDIPPYDKEVHHAIARKAAGECAVLLKNDAILPLGSAEKVAFIGGFAADPRFQGGGSSYINFFKKSNALDSSASIGNAKVAYAKGFDTQSDTLDQTLFDEAVACATGADKVVVFAGLPEISESEGYDRETLDLPDCQNSLIEAIAEVQPNLVVVLHNGSPVRMPWADKVRGILELYLGGQAVGEAAVDLLYGKVNPSGKLAETFPKRLQDTPSYLQFPGTEQEVCYSEGVYVGYRYYDAKEIEVLYPFGYGLSYTDFTFSSLVLSSYDCVDSDNITVTATVKNTGSTAGKEVVQLYVAPMGKRKQPRPIKELKGFDKIFLSPGEEKTVTFCLDKRSFAYYETQIQDWYVESGVYRIFLGNSSVNLPLFADIRITGLTEIPFTYEENTTLGDVLHYCKDLSVYQAFCEKCNYELPSNDDTPAAGATGNLGASTAAMERSMQDGIPLHSLINFHDITIEEIETITNKR